ncbi:MAG: protein kinase domain-containing protein, partial [Balneolaceae bacterium]
MGLTREEWEQVEQIVDEAMTLDHDRRNRYVRQQCAGDKQLYSRVTEMLESIELSEGFLENSSDYKKPLLESFLDQAGQTQSSLVGQELGSYKIVELIGHGGMGSVYLAERSDDTFDQKVALKVIRRGMDTPSIVGRFKREQQILARLTHPNIAHLYNGGITPEGLPYLIMEYVDGCPIDEYCDRKKLSLVDRLNLFQTVLKAVQHAHNNLIVHRDLKPDNILVTDDGVVKILDFGIAKLLEEDSGLRTMFQTHRQARILSLGYAAPEQLDQEHVTTATDTYALGILLYRLLCGKHPYEMDGKKLTELEELIQTVTPPPPSSRVDNLSPEQQSDIAHKRSEKPRKLVKALKGDLDAIVMKALRKRSDMRYLSAGEFIEEIGRYCRGLPVNARKGTLRYQASKFFNRHQKKLSVAAGVLVLTLSFFAFYSYRMTQERNNAEQQAAKAEQISGFIIDIFESNYPENARGDTVPVQDVLREGLRSVESLNEQPLVQAEMYSVIGNIFRHMGSYDEASDALEASIDLYESHLDEPSDDLANAYRNMGTLERDHGSLEEADKFLSRSLLLRETSDDTLLAYDLTMTANVVRQLDQQEKARGMLTRAIEIQRKYYGENNVKLAETIFNLG